MYPTYNISQQKANIQEELVYIAATENKQTKNSGKR